MDNLTITTECLRDLVAFHSERIAGYEAMLSKLALEEQCLATLFNAFIKQSVQLKRELLEVGAVWGMGEDQLQYDNGKFGLAWSVVKTVFSSRIPSYSLDKCKSGENALLIAYHCVEGTEGLQPSVRLLINRQKREVIAARNWIVHFEGLRSQTVPPPPQQLAVVS